MSWLRDPRHPGPRDEPPADVVPHAQSHGWSRPFNQVQHFAIGRVDRDDHLDNRALAGADGAAGLGRLVGDPVAVDRVGDTSTQQRRALTSLLPYSDQQPRSGKPFAI